MYACVRARAGQATERRQSTGGAPLASVLKQMIGSYFSGKGIEATIAPDRTVTACYDG
jgi:hypothetical protein